MPADHRPVWALLRTFSWQEWVHHRWRHGTAMLAVLLGVALAFSVHLINESALSEFSAAVRSVNGQADVSLRAATGGLDESLYATVAAHPQVARASPVIEVQTHAVGRDGQRHPLRVLGLDPLVSGPMAPAFMPQWTRETDRLMLFAPDRIYLNAQAQQRLGVREGDTVSVQRGLTLTTLRVGGHIAAGGPATGVMDIASAQHTLGTLGRVDRLDVQLAAGASVDQVLEALRLPSGVVTERAHDASQRVSNVSRAYRVNLTVLALVALFTGGFLVFSVLSLSVAKRQGQWALLGVLGLTARERLQLVLLESALMGVVGSVLGIALGTALAATALRWTGGDLGGGYFAGVSPTLQWSVGAAMVYASLGVAAAVLGGWVPARAAQSLAPAQALKGMASTSGPGGQSWVGPGLLALGAAMSALPPVGGIPLFAYLGVAALLMGGIVTVPMAVGAVLNRWRAPRQPVALLALERARRMRHTATVAMAGVVASLSLSVALTVMVSSFRGSVIDWLDTVLPADLYAQAADGPVGDEALHVSSALLARLAQLPGVTKVVGIRVTSVSLSAALAPVALLARPVDRPEKTLPLVGELLPPEPGAVGVYISESMAALHDVRPGQRLNLPLNTHQPAVAVQVRGIWRDYARQQGALVMDLRDYQRLSGDTRINDLALWLAPQARTADVQAAVRQAVTQAGLDGQLLTFAEPREIREITLRIFDRSFAVTYWLQAVAIGIGLFGTAASFSAQVLARRKEFGLLAHLGFTRRQVLQTVALEGACLSSVGALMGVVLGLTVSVVLVKVVNPQSFHWTMDLIVPWVRLGALALGVVLAGTVTALLAGRHAASQDAVTAVKEDW